MIWNYAVFFKVEFIECENEIKKGVCKRRNIVCVHSKCRKKVIK